MKGRRIALAVLFGVVLGVTTLLAQSKANDALFDAASNGTAADVQAALKAGANANARDEDGTTALMYAARNNESPDVVKALIDAGANVNARNGSDDTALLIVARYNTNPDVIKSLVAAGADVNVKNKENSTALLIAAEHNSNPDVIKALLDAGSDINAKGNYGATALINAVNNKTPAAASIAKTLIDAGSDVNATMNNKWMPLWTPLMCACVFNSDNLDVIKILIDSGANVNAKSSSGETALMCAVTSTKTPDVVRALINGVANVDAKNLNGRRAIDYLDTRNDKNEFSKTDAYWEIREMLATQSDADAALLKAVRYGDVSDIQAAIQTAQKAGANMRCSTTYALDVAMNFSKETKNSTIFDLLIEAGADVNAIDASKLTKFIQDSLLRQPYLVKSFVHGSLDWSRIDKNKLNSIVHLAAKSGNFVIIESLINYGVVNKDDLGLALVVSIGQNADFATIKALIDAGANVNATVTVNRDVKSMLMYAVECNSEPEVIKTFVDAGADVNAKDQNGVTVLMLAVQKTTYPDVIKILVEAGADIKAEYTWRKFSGDTRDFRAVDYLDDNTILCASPEYEDLKDLLKGRKKKEKKEKKSKKDKKK